MFNQTQIITYPATLYVWAIPSLHNARPICLETLAEYLGQRLEIQEGANRRSEQILK